MLFQILVLLVFCALVVIGRRARKLSEGGSAFFALSAAGAGVVTACAATAVRAVGRKGFARGCQHPLIATTAVCFPGRVRNDDQAV